MKQLKGCIAVILAAVFLMFPAVPAFAAGYDDENLLEDYWEESGLQELWEKIPREARELLEELGLSGIPGTVEGMTPQAFLSTLWNSFLDYLKTPLRLLISLVGIIILCAMLETFGSSFSTSGVEPIFNVVVTVFISSIIINPIVECIVDTTRVIEDFAVFILTYIPVFAGVITASGQPMTGAAYNLFLFWMCQITAQLVTTIFVPLLCAYLALSLLSVVCPKLNLSGLVGGIKTFVTWSLGLILTIFVGLMSIQSVVASSGDSIAVKTTKFFIGSMIPVVGGTLADLFVAAQGCIQLVKGTLGAFGVIVTALTFLPVLIRTGVWYLTINVSSILSELFNLPQITKLLKALSSTLGILVAVLLYDALLVIISTTLLIVTFRAG